MAARTALLDALDALRGHQDNLVLVGAQAIYLHTGEADIAVAEFTTDADLAIDPRTLAPEPDIASAMRSAGFSLARSQDSPLVGIWSSVHEISGISATVNVDLLVPKSLSGPGRRAARIPPHEKCTALKVHGLEAALVDNDFQKISSLATRDRRSFTLRVAGPAALLVSKCIKLGERARDTDSGLGRSDRLKPKDALDVLRILRASSATGLSQTLAVLRTDPIAGSVTEEALSLLPELFGSPVALGSELAARAAYPEPADVIAASCVALADELLELLGNGKA